MSWGQSCRIPLDARLAGLLAHLAPLLPPPLPLPPPSRRAEEERRAAIVEGERRRLLAQAGDLQGYLPRGVLRDNADAELLRSAAGGASPATTASPAGGCAAGLPQPSARQRR
jgi:hypothetical protein